MTRKRHQAHTKSPKMAMRLPLKIKFERIISIISVLIAIFSLYFAWRSNLLSLNQSNDNLVVSDTSLYGGNLLTKETPTPVYSKDGLGAIATDNPYMYCTHKIRLSNLGGSTSSIINFSAKVIYRNETVFLEGYGESVATPKNENSAPFSALAFNKIQAVMIAEEMLKTRPPDESWVDNYETGISFPLEIKGNSSADFIVHTILGIDLEDKRHMFITYSLIPQRGEKEKNPNEDSYPFQITYSFDTLSGKRVSTPPIECLSIMVLPPGEINIGIP